MRRKSSNPFDGEQEAEIDMSPMIDVGFLLLIYFIVATTLMKEEADLNLVLPGTAQVSGEPVKIDQMMIRIDATSSIYVNDEIVEPSTSGRRLPQLSDRLARYAAAAKVADSKAFVIIDCEGDAREQRFIDVLNACTAAGIDNISLTQ
ncbi:MAG: biopolymer transporter ExbD [Verrucomicrobiota bacterium]